MLRLYRDGLLDKPAVWKNNQGARVRLAMLLRSAGMEANAQEEQIQLLTRVMAQSALMAHVPAQAATDFLAFVTDRMAGLSKFKYGDKNALHMTRAQADSVQYLKLLWQTLADAGYCSK